MVHCGKTMWCDVCKYPPEKYEGEQYVSLVLKAAKATDERFGFQHFADVLRGVENEYVKSYKHNTLPVFGKGNEETDDFWNRLSGKPYFTIILRKILTISGCLNLQLLESEFLEKPHSFTLVKDKDFESIIEKEDTNPNSLPSLTMQCCLTYLKNFVGMWRERRIYRRTSYSRIHRSRKWPPFIQPPTKELPESMEWDG